MLKFFIFDVVGFISVDCSSLYEFGGGVVVDFF